MDKPTLVIADDEKNIREGLARVFNEQYRVLLADDGLAAWRLLQQQAVDVVLSDLRMPQLGGAELLHKVVQFAPDLPVIIMTAYATVENAVAAMRNGAYDFLTKPVNLDHLELLLARALENSRLKRRHQQLLVENQRLLRQREAHQLIGNSRAMGQVLGQIEQVADTRASVLITGESGVGKELAANALHSLSARADQPFVKVHCAALSASLLESELFGHEKGAFTGATSQRRGRFELADGGTLFLDEIGEIDATLQVKLLRVLQERSFERVGGEKTIKVDVRLVTATNRDLRAEVEAGRFREDLFYRLAVVSLHLPPLRERLDDLPLLVASFIQQLASENGRQIDGLDAKAEAGLYGYSWPGNVRELRNCLESAVVMSKGPLIHLHDLPHPLRNLKRKKSMNIELGRSLAEIEKRVLAETLVYTGGNKSEAARLLKISRKTLHRKLGDDDLNRDELGE